jgi:hypothetical protein
MIAELLRKIADWSEADDTAPVLINNVGDAVYITLPNNRADLLPSWGREIYAGGIIAADARLVEDGRRCSEHRITGHFGDLYVEVKTFVYFEPSPQSAAGGAA